MAKAVSLPLLSVEDRARSQYMKDLWRTKWQWDRVFSECFRFFLVSNILPMLHTHLHQCICCAYQKDNQAKPWYLPKSSTLPEIAQRVRKSLFTFTGTEKARMYSITQYPEFPMALFLQFLWLLRPVNYSRLLLPQRLQYIFGMTQ
jgi:hypothetical protein